MEHDHDFFLSLWTGLLQLSTHHQPQVHESSFRCVHVWSNVSNADQVSSHQLSVDILPGEASRREHCLLPVVFLILLKSLISRSFCSLSFFLFLINDLHHAFEKILYLKIQHQQSFLSRTRINLRNTSYCRRLETTYRTWPATNSRCRRLAAAACLAKPMSRNPLPR